MVDDTLSDAEGAAHRLRDELNRLGGWQNKELGEALGEETGSLPVVTGYCVSSDRSCLVAG